MKIKTFFKTALAVFALVCCSDLKAQHDLIVENQTGCTYDINIMFIDCCCDTDLSITHTVPIGPSLTPYNSPYTCGRAFYVEVPLTGVTVGDDDAPHTCNDSSFPTGIQSHQMVPNYCNVQDVNFTFTPATSFTNAKLTITY